MKASLKQWFVYIAVIVIGVSIALSAALNAHFKQENSGRENFRHLVEMKHALIENELSWHRDFLMSIGSFMNSSVMVTRDEFMNFARQGARDQKIFNSVGWLKYDPAHKTFLWEHITSYHIPRGIMGRDIAWEPPFYKMAKYAEARGELSYFFVTPAMSFLKDIHRDETETSGNHLLLLHPVYALEENAGGEKTLIGLAFSILDFENLIYQISEHKSYSGKGLVETAAESRDSGGISHAIYASRPESNGRTNQNNSYETVMETSLGNAPIVWRYAPSEQFMEMYGKTDSYVIFIALVALTIAVLILYQMSLTMVMMRSSKQKAEELSRLKSDFLATMSHEIRTPMNGILGMAELILSNRPPKQIENYARTILNSGETLLDIINDILDFSKIEAGKMHIDPTDTDMLELVDDLAALYSVKARDKALEIAVRYMPGSERFVYADPLRIRQIIGNLLSNAIKFTHKGHITITVEEIKSASNDPEQVTLKFSVKDTGIGITPEMQQKIFEKFSQGDSSTTRKYGGTGLGLNISKSLVTLMGGRIGIESRHGEGSTFWFEIPLKRNLEKAPLKLESAILRDVAILIVDDLPVIRQILCEQLADAGLRPGAAESGEEALRMMRERISTKDPYQIVIIDYLMPGMNGEALAEIIQQDEQLKKTCTVMLTAAGNPMADEDFARKGFSAYISKPVQIRALVEALGVVWSHFRSRKDGDNTLIRLDSHNRKQAEEEELSEVYNLEGKNILLAEDNLVNQIFIKEILEGMKCAYTVVSNGQEAVGAVKSSAYDLVLMDCLMPVMDGYEATGAIRALQESGSVDKGLHIIALTANAMKGDREKCVEAGMDDYISKPVRKRSLQDILVKWLKNIDVGEQGSSSEIVRQYPDEKALESAEIVPFAKPADLAVLDLEAVENARSVLKADYAAMVHIFVQNCYERYEEIQAALKGLDTEAIIRPAHTLKSTGRQMGAMQMAETARLIEYAAKKLNAAGEKVGKEDLAAIESDAAKLVRQIEEARSALEKIAA